MANKELTWDQKTCYHKWVKVTLITSVVEHCSKCDARREDVEAYDKTCSRDWANFGDWDDIYLKTKL